MKWILIFWISGIQNYGITTAEFNCYESCFSAASKIQEKFIYKVTFVCVEKGKETNQ